MPENGEKLFLNALQDYQMQLYQTGKDDLLINMRQIANAVLEHYPNHIESLTNLSITHLLVGEIDKALKSLRKAEKINPEDYIVLSNIAHAYNLKKDKAKSIEYYEKVIQYGDEDTKQYAVETIKRLKNQEN